MGDQTKIEWADTTLSLWVGCTQISPACDHCYAMRMAPRLRLGVKWNAPPVRGKAEWWSKIEAYQKGARRFILRRGRPRRVFVNSMADFFDNQVPDQWRLEACERMAAAPDVDFLLVTKRPQNIARMVPQWLGGMWPKNVWLIVTVANQEEADRNVPILLHPRFNDVPVRGLSLEPLLGQVDLTRINTMAFRGAEMLNALSGELMDFMGFPVGVSVRPLDWIIIGGESGRGARTMGLIWPSKLTIDAGRHRVPVFVKQLSAFDFPKKQFKNFEQFPPMLQVREHPFYV
jgi:protein gp37